jgi:hypothetical protein
LAVRRNHEAQQAYPVFRAEAVRGFAYEMQEKAPGWGDILQYLYARTRNEALLEEPLISVGNNADAPAVTRTLRNEPPLEAAAEEWEVVEWQASNPIQQRDAPAWYQGLVSSCIRALSGSGFRLIRRALRGVLLSCRVTVPIAGWLIREKGLLGTGDLRPITVTKQRVFVLAGSIEGALRQWERLVGESRREISSSRFCAVILGTQPTGQNGAALSAIEADLYDLPAMLPQAHHLSAVRYLLGAYPHAPVFLADDCPAGVVDLASSRSVNGDLAD